MRRLFIGGAAATAAFLSGIATAEPAKCPAQEQAQGEHANVLVIQTIQGQEETQMRDGAAAIPMHVNLMRDAEGKVDVDQLVQQTNAQLEDCESIQVMANQGQDAPEVVQQEFEQADQSQEQEALAWRYWLPYRFGGYYGYGYRPYFGYYSHYYPYYGYYYGGYTYPYTFGAYYPYGRFGYYYYYR